MHARWVGIVGSLVLGVALVVSWTYNAYAQPPAANDVEAVRGVIARYVSVINSPEFATGPRDVRARLMRPFYRPDNTFSKNDPPLFLGPLSEPVSRGVEAHLDNTLMNFEFLFRRKMTYGFRVDELQIEANSGLAAVLALTTSGYADGKTNSVTRGRWTIILNKMSNGQWLISHEHSELYNNTNPAILSKQQLAVEIDKLPR